MTAIVGTLNRQGVAIAADSAVTFNGSKVVNSGKKVFMLSKKYPVGIATYNSLNFLTIPWETIIKMYRAKCLKAKEPPKGKLEEYVNDFVDYLRGLSVHFTKERQECHLAQIIDIFVKTIYLYYKDFDPNVTRTAKDRLIAMVTGMKSYYSNRNKCTEFETYTRAEFDSEISPTLEKSVDYYNNLTTKLSGQNLKDVQDAIKDAYFAYIISQSEISDHTGLIFFGYGDDEIFPSLIPININLYWNGRIRCYMDDTKTVTIDYNCPSALKSFAQTDVADSLVSGIDSQLASIIYQTYQTGFKDFAGIVADAMESAGVPKTDADRIRNIDVNSITQRYFDQIKSHVETNYTQRFINSIDLMGKEDMADLAQSLVSLTGLKRHVTENIETVGGPVDVAVVSKADGFIWIKRKHYFDPKLNAQFFNLYNEG